MGYVNEYSALAKIALAVTRTNRCDPHIDLTTSIASRRIDQVVNGVCFCIILSQRKCPKVIIPLLQVIVIFFTATIIIPQPDPKLEVVAGDRGTTAVFNLHFTLDSVAAINVTHRGQGMATISTLPGRV